MPIIVLAKIKIMPWSNISWPTYEHHLLLLLIDKYNRLSLFQPTSLQMTYKDILYSQVHCSHFISLTHTLCYTIRLYLAMLHYNENCGRQQAQIKKGENRYAVLYPKYKKGGHVVRKLVEHCTYGMP